MQKSDDVSQMLTEKQVSHRLNVSQAALRKWRWEGSGPGYLRLGKCIRYRKEDLDKWLESCKEGK